jgi:HK97 family phage prohead protease
MQRKQLFARVEKSNGVKVDATISTETIDRDGEVLVAQGMDSSEFDKNPVVFYNHDYAQPVGKVTDLRRGKGKVDATIEFAKRPDDFEGAYFPEFVESLVEQGVVKGISVGFIPQPGGVRKASQKDREDYGDSVRQVFSKWKLLEVSVAPLPANSTALVSAIRKGAVDPAQVDRWLTTDSRRRVFVNMPKVPRLRLSNM